MTSETAEAIFTVLRHETGRLGLWPATRPTPYAWTPVGFDGPREACLAHLSTEEPVDVAPAPAEGRTLLSLLADRCERFADRIALSDGGAAVTYRELANRADTLAARLRRHGVARGDRVMLCLPRGVEFFVAMAGVLRAGGAYVPVDREQPAEHRRQMSRLSGTTMVLGDPSDPAWDFRGAPEVLRVTSDEPGLFVSATTAEPKPRPGDLAAVLFTSGSSDEPKAVGLSHANLAHFAENQALPTLRPTDRVGHVSSLSFDAVHFETWCALAAGAEIAVLARMPDLLGADLGREIRRRRITAMLVPTMAFHHLMREDREALAPLRVLCVGGDALSPSAVRELLDSSFAGDFYNLYGPTEATTACLVYQVTEVPQDASAVPIGVPLDGCTVDLLDDSLDEVPLGDVGELHVGGPGVATHGYLGRPDLTADRFLPAPDPGLHCCRYATGDRVFRRPDGLIEFVGRTDDQVKIRGYRVEPGQVQRVLGGHPGVTDAAVVVVGDGDHRRLVAFVVSRQDMSLPSLRTWVGERLPEHLVPSAMIGVPEIPANGRGKRDLSALRALAGSELGRQADRVAPGTAAESYLAALWAELLRVERVGATDDFFELGGNSLLAFRAQRRIRTDLGITIQTRDVLSVSKLLDLARLIEERQVTEA
jgi:amino acid adenylation domain-containing protein